MRKSKKKGLKRLNLNRLKVRHFEDFLKLNAIRIARHHRKYCEGEKCDASLYFLAELLKRSGIKLTKIEMLEFL